MMLCIFLLLLSGSSANEANYPQFAYIEIVPKGQKDNCKGVNWGAEYCDSLPKEDNPPPELCKSLMKSFKGYECIENEETDKISEVLSQVDESVECLYVTHRLSNVTTIDFNYLPRQMTVILSSTLPDYFDDAEIPSYSRVKIVGNIKDKVTFLIVNYMTVVVIQSNLNVPSLLLLNGWLEPSSQFAIKSTYFISYLVGNNNILNNLKDYSLLQPNYYQIAYLFNEATVNFGNDSLEIKSKYTDSFESNSYLPYNLLKTSAGIMIQSGNLILNASADSIVPDNFNITFEPNFLQHGPMGATSSSFNILDVLEELTKTKRNLNIEKNKAKVTITGNYWENHKPKISINRDPTFYEIDTKELEPVANIVTNTIHSIGGELTNTEDMKDDKSGLSTGGIVGIVVGCVAFVAIVVVVVVIVLHKKNKIRAASSSN